MEILEVKDSGTLVRDNEVQSRAGILSSWRGGFGMTHAFGQAPRPHRHRIRVKPHSHLAQNVSYPLLFGRANVGERPARLENLPNHRGGPALGCRRSRIFRRVWRGGFSRHSAWLPVSAYAFHYGRTRGTASRSDCFYDQRATVLLEMQNLLPGGVQERTNEAHLRIKMADNSELLIQWR